MISQTAEYALRAMVLLAEAGESPTPTDVIARETRAPFGYLVKIMAKLSRSGLVTAQRGRHGGFVLSRPAQEISLHDILVIADPVARDLRCPTHGDGCPLYIHLRAGCERSQAYWRKVTLNRLRHRRRDRLSRP